MMTGHDTPYPEHYTRAIRLLLRYALVLLVVGLLVGIASQESSKKLSFTAAPNGLHWDATMHLSLVHGHLILTGVLLPIALAGMLHLARAHGGRDVGPRALMWLVRGYLSFVSLSMGLMLYKGYHALLSVRGGATDMDAIDAALFAGSSALRHGIYGFSHVGMGVSLSAFTWCLWRSLRADRT